MAFNPLEWLISWLQDSICIEIFRVVRLGRMPLLFLLVCLKKIRIRNPTNDGRRRVREAGGLRRQRNQEGSVLLLLVLLVLMGLVVSTRDVFLATTTTAFWASTMHTSTTRTSNTNNMRRSKNRNHNRNQTKQYHTPAPIPENCENRDPSSALFEDSTDDYDQNPTAFGAILRGEAPAACLIESTSLLAFRDRSPRAQFHALIIPKRWIRTVQDLTKDDLPMLHEMKQMADSFLTTTNQQRLVFHIPPFHSVDHLHLHVLDEETLDWIGRIKYRVETRHCTEWRTVVNRLERNESPTRFAASCNKGRPECFVGTYHVSYRVCVC